MKSKKGSEMIFSPIMAAAIVLLIIAVSVVILTKKSGEFASTISSCEQNNGECVNAGECETSQLGYDCPKSKDNGVNKICCAKRIGFT